MFRNPVFDLIIVVPALMIAGLLSLFIMTRVASAQALPDSATTTSAVTASTSGTTLPDATQKTVVVRRSGELATTTTNLPPASSIRTVKELETYARLTLIQDSALESITLSSQGISVEYRKQGRLLGLVTLSVPRRASVASTGSVQFTEPWYGKVTLVERDRMKTALEVRVRTLLSSEGYLASMALAPATQAEILAIIRELIG